MKSHKKPSNSSLEINYSDLPLSDQVEYWKHRFEEERARTKTLEIQTSNLEERLKTLEAYIYGRKSEKRDALPGQLPIQLSFASLEEGPSDETPQESNESEKTEVNGYSRKKPGRRPLPPELPRVEIRHEIDEKDRICCGQPMKKIGEEVCEKLDVVPAKAIVERHIKSKYACVNNCCSDSGKGPVVTAKMPEQIIPQGIATPGLIAHTIIAKYVDSLPLYRQERQFARIGIELSRVTMWGWIKQVAFLCELLVDMILCDIRSGPIINMDETTVQVLSEPGRSNSNKSYFWVMTGGSDEKRGVVFRYSPTRAASAARDMLADYKGFLQTDGYLVYNLIGETEGITLLGCLAHCRRKFTDVIKGVKNGSAKQGVANEVIDLIGKLYDLERNARQEKMTVEEIYSMRQGKSKPIMEKLKTLLDKRKNTTPPKSLLGKAITYALNQWSRLEVYLTDGRLKIDNNVVENILRVVALGRKNWLFCGSVAGAEAAATIFSLLETAKLNGHEPYSYMKYLLTFLPAAKRDEDMRALLPYNLSRETVIDSFNSRPSPTAN